MWREFIKNYLDFSRRERRGIYILLACIVVCYLLPYCLPAPDFPDIKTALLFPENAVAAGKRNTVKSTSPATYFFFDPNTLPLQGFLDLGIREKTALTIIHYREKGGHFRQPADLAKIYGLPAAQAAALAPYVRIGATVSKGDGRPAANAGAAEKRNSVDTARFSHSGFHRDSLVFKRKTYVMTDINQADSVAWMQLPGIGPGFAGRITRFRDRLGGFYSVRQVGETYGLPDSTFKKIEPFLQLHETSLKKIDLNQADEKTLGAHPYIRYSLAKLITRYRNSHGPFTEVTGLRQIAVINDSVYQRIAPYLTITPKP
ncbi:hypothetical protein DCC81_00360 [Chitinophaga parva]|uniref:Uncharacterized protein n=1 Tax=Chitinophaga parva TaxID=2169414 RepID=A0A2T7BJY4_9BACT|nr:helix-hairpin-helix domain-containing protein [Chitinophaga parva]PUZ27978.1 hypothetical protein DCC81_00360 [Chitinophaga parva]